ncbi:TPA: hypothetical protein H1005_03610 [archaeon]|nr:hypothetical protein [Candidatus Naiadarchaeales archaeon SRR2090153.bin1042]
MEEKTKLYVKTILEKWFPTIIVSIISSILLSMGVGPLAPVIIILISLPISALVELYFFGPRRKKEDLKDIMREVVNKFEINTVTKGETHPADKQELLEAYQRLLSCALQNSKLCAENSKTVESLVTNFKNLDAFLKLYGKYLRLISSSDSKLKPVINQFNSLADYFETEAKKVEKITGKKLDVYASEYKIS